MKTLNSYTKRMQPLNDEKIFHARKKGELLKNGKGFRLIDLFSGVGGLTLGFTKDYGHNFKTVWANDIDPYATESYNLNFGNHCVVGDIIEILKDPKTKIPKADVVMGGPPCQGFSLLNKKRNKDPRKQLWHPFLEVVGLSRAQVFVMENVPQLLGSLEHRKIIKAAEALGFKTVWAKLCCADYGVPQKRWRAFILGCRFADPREVFPPKKTHYPKNNGSSHNLFQAHEYIQGGTPWLTVKDAIGNLPDPLGTKIREASPPLDLHFGRSPTPKSLRRYKIIPNRLLKKSQTDGLNCKMTA
ncbi:MAG: DNA cytosine methyltransferase, partial [Nitrospinales bacterium]